MAQVRKRVVRGATLNAVSGRFNMPHTEAAGDWLDEREAIDGAPPPVRTTVTVERPKTIISRNTSPDVPFDRSINAYRGCDQRRNGCASVRRWWIAYSPLSGGDTVSSRSAANARQHPLNTVVIWNNNCLRLRIAVELIKESRVRVTHR